MAKKTLTKKKKPSKPVKSADDPLEKRVGKLEKTQSVHHDVLTSLCYVSLGTLLLVGVSSLFWDRNY